MHPTTVAFLAGLSSGLALCAVAGALLFRKLFGDYHAAIERTFGFLSNAQVVGGVPVTQYQHQQAVELERLNLERHKAQLEADLRRMEHEAKLPMFQAEAELRRIMVDKQRSDLDLMQRVGKAGSRMVGPADVLGG